MINISIEKQIDNCKKEIFTFWFYDMRGILYLDTYSIQQRETPRHKYHTIKQYARLDHQRNPMKWIKLEDVPFTKEIKKLALDKFVSELKVDVWKEGD